MLMNCTTIVHDDDIQALIDGTLGPIRAAELEQHLDQCDACRALAHDLRRIRDSPTRSAIPSRPITSGCRSPDACGRKAASTISPVASATGRRQLRVAWRSPPRSCSPSARRCAADAAIHRIDAPAAARRRAGQRRRHAMPSKVAWRTCGRPSELLQSGVAKLKEGLGSDGSGVADRQLPRTLDTNLQILDQAIAESSDAVQKEPQNVAARNSLFEALQRKISLLQDTITLMNEMRKGNAAGVAQVVEGTNKS